MSTTPTPRHDPGYDPAIAAALAEVIQLGLTVVRLAHRLAHGEHAVLDTLEQEEAAAARALVDPPSLAAARQAGQDADNCIAAREAARARGPALIGCYVDATLAVRRTAALHARLTAGRPFRPFAPPPGRAVGHAPAGSPGSRPRAPRPAFGRPRPRRTLGIQCRIRCRTRP